MNDNSYTPVNTSDDTKKCEIGISNPELTQPKIVNSQHPEIQQAPERKRLSKEERGFAVSTAQELIQHIKRQPMSAATRLEIMKQLSIEHTKALGFSGKSTDSRIAEKLTQICPELAVTARHDKSGELWSYNNNQWSHINSERGEAIVARALRHTLAEGVNHKKAQSVFKMLRSIANDKPNRKAGLIPYLNGVYEISTGKFHQHHADFGIEGLIPCNYTSEYQPPERFIQFVKSASNDNPERHQLMLAQFKYHIENRYRDQIFFENIGDGGCGLSTMQAVITALVGRENVANVGLDVVDGARSDKHATVPLVGKQAWIVSDAKKTVSDFPTLKAITGGDPITIRDMQKSAYQITMPMTVSVFSNSGLQSTDRSGGLFRRRIVIKYDRRVTQDEKDPLLVDNLIAELPHIIQYINKILPEDRYKQVIADARHGADKLDVMSETESVFGFISECIHITGDAADKTQVGSMLTFNKAKAKSDHGLLKITGQQTLFGCYQLWCEYKGITRSIKAGFEKAFEDTVNLKCSDSAQVRRIAKARPTHPEKLNKSVSCIEGVMIVQDHPMFEECQSLHEMFHIHPDKSNGF